MPDVLDDDLPGAARVVAETRAWMRRAVIGLNLCPFARAVDAKDQVRCVTTAAAYAEALLRVLVDELRLLAEADPAEVDTTLLVHPRVFGDFEEFNDFLELVDAAVEELGLDGELQVASFHPDYQFADTAPDDVTNATNRAPYPTLHLLREASVDRAVAAFPQAEAIFERNMETLERLGVEGWERLREQWESDADAEAPRGS
jgi:hypothetical protein